jgi:protein SCO1
LSILAMGARATTVRDIQQRVGIDPHPGRELPLSISLRDEAGAPLHLGDLLGRRPAVLALVYYECPNLCTLTLTNLTRSLRAMDLSSGRDFEVIAVSIDPRESPALAAAKRAAYLDRYGRHLPACAGCDSGWHFLTARAAESAALAHAVGMRYFWDPVQAQYAHPSALVIVTPRGRISRYLNGVEFPVWELRQALTEAAGEHTSSLAQRLWLLCYHYEALVGRYSALVTTAVRVLAALVALSLATLIFRLIRTSP